MQHILKNKHKLSSSKQKALGELIKLFPTLGEAYRLKELFNDLWDQDTEEDKQDPNSDNTIGEADSNDLLVMAQNFQWCASYISSLCVHQLPAYFLTGSCSQWSLTGLS